MGYDLHIERENGLEISVNEWVDYLDSDCEFKRTDEVTAELEDGTVLTAQIPNSGLWLPESKNVTFMFSEVSGSVIVKNPDESIIEKMIAVSSKLNALVRGDDGETYDLDNLQGAVEKSGNEERDASTKRWWEFWKE